MPMANLTIRKLDDAIRDALRLGAASNGRSVKDEGRVILRAPSKHSPSSAAAKAVSQGPATHPHAHSEAAGSLPRVTLIIGGGIAAYKALELIRRLKKRRIHR